MMGEAEERLSCRHCGALWEYPDYEYCPECDRNYGGALYPATQTEKELSDAAKLIESITEAFAGTELGDGVTLHEADLEGAYCNDAVRLAARAKDTESRWQDIPDWKLERFGAALSFFDVGGWKFYIPAYMIWSVKHWRSTRALTADKVIWGFELSEFQRLRFESLSDEQSTVVLCFLKHLDEYSGEPDAKRAIQPYWERL